MSGPAESRKRIQDIVLTLLAFIDALGLVIARVIVVAMIGTIAVTPYTLLLWFATRQSSILYFYFAVFGYYAFFIATLVLFVEYMLALRNLTYTEFIPTLPMYVKGPWRVCAFPFYATVIGGVVFYRLVKTTYLEQRQFDMLILYFASLTVFVTATYAAGSDPDFSLYLFANNAPVTLKDSILFTLDLAMRGFLFDFFEHFRIHLSPVEQSHHMGGLVLTYALRLSSSALAISIVLELVKATKRRLAKLEEAVIPR